MAFDIGGTFTDLVLAGPDVPPRFLEVASSPNDRARAVIAGLDRLLDEAGVAAAGLGTTLHATTVATNAIRSRTGTCGRSSDTYSYWRTGHRAADSAAAIFCCRTIRYAAIATPMATVTMMIVASALMSGRRPRRILE